MKRTSKTLIVTLLVSIMLLTSIIPTFAAQNDPPTVTPQWDNILDATIDMTFVGTSGEVVGSAFKEPGASHIEGTILFYKQNGNRWELIGEWYNSVEIGSLYVIGTFYAEERAVYKALFTVTAYRNGVGESETFEIIDINVRTPV